MKEFLEKLVRYLVEKPDKVEVSEVDGEGVIILKLKVDKEDIGIVIGKRGRTADSLRTILNAVGAKAGKRLVLEILES